MSLQGNSIGIVLERGEKRLVSSPAEAITSRDEVREAGHLASEWVEGGVTIGFSLERSPTFEHFLEMRPLTRPPFAFFSWALANFCLLNLVVILEKKKKKKWIAIGEKRWNTHSFSELQDFFEPYLTIPDPENEGIAIRDRRARQNPWRSPNIPDRKGFWRAPNIPSPFQHDDDISSSNGGIEELPTEQGRICRRQKFVKPITKCHIKNLMTNSKLICH